MYFVILSVLLICKSLFFKKKNMPIIIVHVVFNPKTVFEWEELPVNDDINIEEFF